MFKFKNFKILLLLMIFAFAENDAWAGDGNWMYMHIQVDSYPTAAGKVYASSSQSSAQNTNNCVNSPYIDDVSTAEKYINQGKTLWYVNTIPTDASKWAFVGWVKDAANDFTDFYNTTYVSTDRNPTSGFADPGTYASSTADGHGPPIDHSKTPYYYPDPFPITLRMTAVYRSIKPDVIAVTNNGELGTTDFTDANNSVGETVVLSATPSHYNSKFEGWYKDGVCVSKSNPLSFEITEDNKGTYTARFVEHKFMRIKNSSTNRYINGVNDVGSITNFSSLLLEGDRDAIKYLAGTVIYLWDYERTNPTAHPYVFDIQGFSSSSYYDDTRGIYVTILHNNIENTWTISDKDKSYYMTDKGTESVEMAAINAGFPLGWVFEHIDNDLETCENYFSLDPAKLVEVDGKYYTTLRTSWNILFNPEQMTPYIVKSVDEENGTFEMEPITGNIIPAGTPVIIETNSNDIEENRMVPTMTVASDAVPSGNLLKVSEKYFPNQSAPVENCKGLTVKDGQLAFGGDALSTVNGNEAYLSVANDVILPNKIPNVTLAELLQSGDIEKTYCVTDLTCVYARDKVLYCKDDNNAIRRSEMNEGEIDYVRTVAGLQTSDWDQSNWIAVKLPSEANPNYLDHRLTKVVGRLTNTVNPEFEVTVAPSIGAENPYDENTYISCNFSGSHQANVTINGVEHNYYFVEPKPMEIANVKWALWNGETFSKPSNASSDLNGEFAADFSFSGEPSSAGVYNFPALIKIAPTAQGVMPRAQDEATTSWLVFPLELTNQPVTSVEDLNTGKTAVKVVYYNLMGVGSAVPHNGVNIVETRYSDGTRTTTKIIR